MTIIDGSLRNSTAVLVGMILTCLFGYLAFRSIPIQLNPTIETPFITVETRYPGASAIEVEQEVTNRQEERLAAVEKLREMRSESVEGEARITLKFDWGINKDLAQLDVLQKINLVEDLPDEVKEPQILAVNRREEETVNWLYIEADPKSGLSVNRIRRIVDDLVLPQLERVEDIAVVRRYGGAEREIHVLVDVEALTARDLSLTDIANVLRRENRTIRGGDIERGATRYVVRTPAQYSSLDEIRRTIIANGPDGPVRIGDVATVEDAHEDPDIIVRVNGQPTVVMGIVKQPGKNTLDVATRVRRQVERINEDIAPRGLRINFAYDAAEYIWDSIRQVRQNLLIGALLAVGVLWLFLRSIRTTLIIGITIPVCMIGTFVLLAAAGRSINVISLAGLAFASGMILDSGIVVLENIFRHRTELGRPILTAAREATIEVWAPIVAGTLTTQAVFIPILFVQEEAGQLFRDIACSIAFAVGLSMISAITVVPMFASRLLGGLRVRGAGSETPREDGWVRWLHPGRLLHRLVDPVFGYPAWIVSEGLQGIVRFGLRHLWACLLFIALLVCGFFSSLWLVPPAEYLPSGNRNMIFAFTKTPAGLSLERAESLMRPMEEKVLNLPELKHTFFVILRDGPIFGVVVQKEHAQKENIQRIVAELQRYAASLYPFPDVIPIVSQAQVFGRGLTTGKGLTVDVRGPDLVKLETLSNTITDQLRTIPGVLAVRPSLDLGNPEFQVIPDRDRLSDLGLTASDVGETVETLVEGRITSLYREGGKEYDLVLKGMNQQITGVQDLERVTLSTPTGQKVKLVDVARVERRLGPTRVEHLEQDRSVSLQVTIDEKMPLEPLIEQVNREIVEPLRARLPFEYTIGLSGSADDLARTMTALSSSFLLALVIIYLLMAALFRSFLYPMIIMFSVPPALSGAILALRLMHSEYNVITMLGFILLAGVVVNNAILLVNVTLLRVREGASHRDAIAEAVRLRIRPIFITSLTSVLGMMPLALGKGAGAELYSGLGVAVVGGLTLSTVVTLILIPMLLRVFMGLRDGIAHGLGREELTEAGRARMLAELDRRVADVRGGQ